MAANFQLRIVTPEKILYSGDVVSLQAPGSEGSFGVLASHAPMVVALKTGSLDFVEDGDRLILHQRLKRRSGHRVGRLPEGRACSCHEGLLS